MVIRSCRFIGLLIFCSCVATSGVCFCQKGNQTTSFDTIVLKKGQFISINKKTYQIKQDTTFLIPSNMKYEVMDNKSEQFYNQIEKNFHKYRLLRELHNFILEPEHKGTNIDSFISVYNSVIPYIMYSGRHIRNIEIKELNVFGPTIHDTTRQAKTWTEQTANRFHFESKPYLITNNIFFKKGDLLNPLTIADDERLLRALPYIEDAKILVTPVNESKDSVDVIVITKDNWPDAFNISVSSSQSGNFEIWNRNLFGYGHQIQNSLLWNSQFRPMLGYMGNYALTNISKTLINANLSYLHAFQNEIVNLSLTRPFLIPNIKYGGGISLVQERLFLPLTFDTVTANYTARDYHYDIWIGRSFLLTDSTNFTKKRQNITITARVIHDGWPEKPAITSDMYYNLQNKTTFLGSVSLTKQSYLKSNLIYNFGRTEDIPIGQVLQINLGYENNQFGPRRYAGMMAGQSIFYKNIGYVYGALSLGSFINEDERLEQGIETASLHYFSPLIIADGFKFRQFLNFDYVRGINRFQYEYLTINNSYGVEGFNNDSIRGTNRLNIHWETVCFTPFSIYDFRTVFFLTLDHSWLTYKLNMLFKSRPYTGIGFGIRIRNDRLVFNTIQIRIAYYPNIPPGTATSPFTISGEPLLMPPTFLPQPASLFTYQ